MIVSKPIDPSAAVAEMKKEFYAKLPHFSAYVFVE